MAAKQNKTLMEMDKSDLLKSFFTFFNSAGHRSSFLIFFKLYFMSASSNPLELAVKQLIDDVKSIRLKKRFEKASEESKRKGTNTNV